jgi:hypothetical protein
MTCHDCREHADKRAEYAAEARSLRERLKDEQAQRIHEARLAREAITHLRTLTEQGDGAAKYSAAQAWLDKEGTP